MMSDKLNVGSARDVGKEPTDTCHSKYIKTFGKPCVDAFDSFVHYG